MKHAPEPEFQARTDFSQETCVHRGRHPETKTLSE